MLAEETFQLPQCKAENKEDDLPIPESHDDVSETVRQISSDDEEDSVFDFIRVFAYNSDGEYIELRTVTVAFLYKKQPFLQ